MNMLTNTMTNTQKCSTMCKNCQGTSTKCFSCNDGWRLLGVKCVQITPISVKMYPLSPSTSTVPFSSHLWPSLASSLLGALGINSQTEPYVVFTNPTKDGSFGLLISPQSGSNLPQTVNEVISILNKKTSAFGYGTM